MNTNTLLENMDFYSPAVFSIEVKGKVDKGLWEYPGEPDNSYHLRDDKIMTTKLEEKERSLIRLL